MYGTIALPKIMNEAKKLKILTLDIWPLVHGNQREQMEKMGHNNFKQLLDLNNIKLGSITRYDLGPFKLQNEMKLCSKLGRDLLVCGGKDQKV